MISDIRRSLEEAVASGGGGRVEIEFNREDAAYQVAEDHPGVALALRAARKLGLPSALKSMGGGSDANTLNERGLPSVALGIGMQQPHTLEEHIAVDDLVGTAAYLIALIGEAAAVA